MPFFLPHLLKHLVIEVFDILMDGSVLDLAVRLKRQRLIDAFQTGGV